MVYAQTYTHTFTVFALQEHGEIVFSGQRIHNGRVWSLILNWWLRSRIFLPALFIDYVTFGLTEL